MQYFLLRRLAQALLTVFIVLTIVFFLSLLTGDPVAVMYPDMAPEQLEKIREELGLSGSVIGRYLDFLAGVLTGDLGTSLTFRRGVVPVILEHIVPTLQLVAVAMVIAAALGLAIGILAARFGGGPIDRASTVLISVMQSIPPFWSGIVLVLVFAVSLHWLPTSGYGETVSIVLPSVTLALYSFGVFARITRASILERRSDLHVLAARARGVVPTRIFRRHVLRNSLPPVIAAIGYRTAELAGGAVVIEVVFGWPGLGSLLLNAVFRRDYMLIQGCVLTVALFVIVINLFVDLLLPLLDRRLASHVN